MSLSIEAETDKGFRDQCFFYTHNIYIYIYIYIKIIAVFLHKKPLSFSFWGCGYLVQVSAESANQFGELVADPTTNELLHYTEKPETFVSIQFRLFLFIFLL